MFSTNAADSLHGRINERVAMVAEAVGAGGRKFTEEDSSRWSKALINERERLVEDLTTSSTFNYVSFGDMDLDLKEGRDAYLPALANQTALTCLNLSYNDLGASTREAFLPGLSCLTRLSLLDLECCRFRETHLLLNPLLIGLQALKNLNVSGNNFSSNEMVALADGIRDLKALSTLDLSRNLSGFDTISTMAITRIVNDHSSLSSLNLSYNSFGLGPDDVHAVHNLATNLNSHTVLISLKLNGCKPESASSLLCAILPPIEARGYLYTHSHMSLRILCLKQVLRLTSPMAIPNVESDIEYITPLRYLSLGANRPESA